ncbi:MAG: fibronectin type III domain-containing protein [Chloroflexi bacterium]|nr:fibronectin type III domain-containing protein [Chloroflexota bacterium]
MAGRVVRRVCGWPARRVGLAVVVGGLLLSAALLGHVAPLLAQEGVGIAFDDLSSYPTETTVDGFNVQLTNLDADVAYQVVVSSDNAAAVGVGACGTATQTRSVTGATAQDLRFLIYACAVAPVTLTAEVRLAGAATAAATVSRALTVLDFPVGAPAGVRGVVASRGPTKAGTPGIVPEVRFDSITSTSAQANWGKPSSGGDDLTGFGLLLWTGPDHPNYGDAFVVGKDSRNHVYTGLQPNTTYKFRIHACNGDDSCGHWTHPPVEFTTLTAPTAAPTPTPTSTPTIAAPDRPHTITFHDTTSTSVRVTWRAPGTTGGAPLTGFDLKYWPYDSKNPNAEVGATTQRADGGNDRSETLRGLDANTEYELKMRACNQANNTNCSRWSADHRFTTNRAPTPAPGAPSFGSTGSLTSTLPVGHGESLTLPAASGGSGALTYQLAPAVGNGLTFDAATRTLAGTPLAATNLATYTYTVTDAAKKTAQIPLHLTVFDVRVRVVQSDAFKPLANSKWGSSTTAW